MMSEAIISTTEVRRHNGQCAYGQWMPLDEQFDEVVEAIVAEILECTCRDMRHEESNGNTESRGRVVVGGQVWLYRD
jgi:hypothetical protein